MTKNFIVREGKGIRGKSWLVKFNQIWFYFKFNHVCNWTVANYQIRVYLYDHGLLDIYGRDFESMPEYIFDCVYCLWLPADVYKELNAVVVNLDI